MQQPTLDDMMHAYALDAVDFAREKFNVTLDFSEGSLKSVEKILNHLHETYGDFSDDDMDALTKMFGGYVSEVMKQFYGGHWKLETRAFPGAEVLTFEILGHDLWPHFKAGKRLVNGSEDNIWFYYRVLKQDFEKQRNAQ